MKNNKTSKEYFNNLLNEKDISLSKDDFEQSYLSYRNFRKNYSELLEQEYSNFEPRQRIFDIKNEQ